MTLAELYAQNARQCTNAAERADNPVHRVMLLRVTVTGGRKRQNLRIRLPPSNDKTCWTADGIGLPAIQVQGKNAFGMAQSAPARPSVTIVHQAWRLDSLGNQ